MKKKMFEEDESRGWMFGGTVLGTVAIGLVLAGMAIYYFRAATPPPPVVIEKPPVIEYVQVPAPTPPLVAVTPPPAPPPPPPPSPPPAKIEAAPSVWDGVWRKEKSSFPVFKLRQIGDSIEGDYAPGWAGVYPFQDGKIADNIVEFVATDGVFRAHFRMTMQGADKARVEGCVTDDDWLSGLANANRMVRTPQQAALARRILADAAKRKGKWTTMGVFVRRPSDPNP
jgi:hypothetical protein